MGHHRHSQGSTAKQPKEAESLARRHHNFTIELFLDELGEASEIFIVHDQSGEKENLTSWETEKLIDFIAQHAGLQTAKSAPEELTVHRKQASRVTTSRSVPETSPASRHVSPSKVSTELAGTPQLRGLKVVSVGSDNPSYLLRDRQPFMVHFTVDLTDVVVSRKVPLIYQATLIARQPGGPDLTAGEARMRIEASKSTTVSVASTGLPPGLYRLGALVRVMPAGMEHEHNTAAVAYLEGDDLIEVF